MQDLADESIDLIITSPPYWGLRTYGLAHNWDIYDVWKQSGNTDSVPSYQWYRENGGLLGMEPLPEWFTHHLVELFELSKAKLKAGGSIWVNIGDTYFARWSSIRDEGRQGLGETARHRRKTPMGDYRQEKQLLLIPARFAIEMQSKKWILRNDLIWHKPNVPPRPEKDRLRLAHEHFFHFVKKPVEGRAKYYYDLSKAEAQMNDVVTCNVRSGKDGHSATFPEDLITPRILSSCPEGGTVLDPFSGSGTTVRVAAKLNRQAIGFELSEKFANSSKKSSVQAQFI
ncbi:MAG: site-specific DNA-methyltransferase [Hymenobacter sp.]|nr:site-specific DNA-methyltransferase [Hymenobacter sp.]